MSEAASSLGQRVRMLLECPFRLESNVPLAWLWTLRAVGLDAGPLGGFDSDKVDATFFAGTSLKSNFIINIGYGDPEKLFPRNPRLDFEEIASFA